MLAKSKCIIGKLKSKYWFQTHKFGVNTLKSVQETNAFYEENGNTLWWDVICKEIKNIRPDDEVWEKEISELPPGYQNIACQMIFDVKMGKKFRRKAQLVADGNKTKTPAEMTYLSVVSRNSVWITRIVAEPNDLDVLAYDIHNTYLTADCIELVWVAAGPKLGSKAGNNMLMRKAVYVLKSSGSSFRALLAETLDTTGYMPSYSD